MLITLLIRLEFKATPCLQCRFQLIMLEGKYLVMNGEKRDNLDGEIEGKAKSRKKESRK